MRKSNVTIYDTTLRDGTQGTGISFSVTDKIRVAEKLDAFGVDYIEGGFPGSNPKDAEFFKEVKKRKWKHAKVTAFGPTRRGKFTVEDDPLVRLLLEAETPAVTIVGKTWPMQVTGVLDVSLQENLAMISDTVRYLKSKGREVLYDAEHFFDTYKDGEKGDRDYAMATLKAACDAGVDMLVLCDTNGGSLPEYVGRTTQEVIAALKTPVGIHTHNDCGLGVANALAAVRAGAVQVQGTINGYGERVGNCDLITTMGNLQLKMGTPVAADLTKLRDLSLFVDELANLPHNIRAPYVGAAAFTHKGGQHVHAIQKFSHSYEHIDPKLVGNQQTIVMSDMAGQSNVLVKAKELGFEFEKNSLEVKEILAEVKRRENDGYEYEAADASFALLIRKVLKKSRLFSLNKYQVSYERRGQKMRSVTSSYSNCKAKVDLTVNGEGEPTEAVGDGPVNALDTALRQALRPFYPQIDKITLEDYKVRIIASQKGTAARTLVLIASTDGHKSWGTVGVSDNIIEASWLALVDSFEYKLQDGK